MATRDQVHRVAFVPSLALAAIGTNTVTNGASVDTLGFEAVTLVAKVLARTDGTYTFKVQTGPDGLVWTDLASYSPGPPAVAPQVIGGTNALSLAGVAIGMLGVNDCQRYVRVVVTSTGVTTGGSVCADFMLGYPRHSGVAV